MGKTFGWVLALVAAIMCSLDSQAAVIYSTVGSPYTQNFDSLPIATENASLGASPIGWTDDNAGPGVGNFSIVGWYLYHPTTQSEGGFNNHQRMRIGAGTANTGAFMSFGASTVSERALGTVGSNTLVASNGDIFYGLRLTNNTGVTLGEFTLSYTAEQWRDGGTSTTGSVAQSVAFAYKTTNGAANLQDTGFTSEPLLGFTSPKFGALAGTALDGNLPANRVAVSYTVTGLSWASGDDLWLRWADPDHPSNDHGLGIDDVSFSAQIPEPASASLLALATIGAIVQRRRS